MTYPARLFLDIGIPYGSLYVRVRRPSTDTCGLAGQADRADPADTAGSAHTVVVEVRGEVDMCGRPGLSWTLSLVASDQRVRLLVCDLSGATFLACAGIRTLLEAQALLGQRDAELRVVATHPAVLRTFAATGCGEALRLSTDRLPDEEGRPELTANDKIDQASGKAKEVAGKLTDDEDLEREGRSQHGIAKAKDAVKDAADKVSDAAQRVVGKDR